IGVQPQGRGPGCAVIGRANVQDVSVVWGCATGGVHVMHYLVGANGGLAPTHIAPVGGYHVEVGRTAANSIAGGRERRACRAWRPGSATIGGAVNNVGAVVSATSA